MMAEFAGAVAIDRLHVAIERDDPRIDLNFLAQFAQRRRLQGLANLNQTSGQRKSTRERRLGAPGEKNPARPEDGDAHAKIGTPRISPCRARSALGPRGERTGWAHG